MTALSVAHEARAEDPKHETAAFLQALELAQEILLSQSQILGNEDLPEDASATSQLTSLVDALDKGSSTHKIQLLHIAMLEIRRRQEALSRAAASRTPELSPASIAGTAHKIITNLDVALSCCSEVAAMDESRNCDSFCGLMATEGAKALRMAAQHVKELNDLASMGLQADQLELQMVRAYEPMNAVVLRLGRIASAQCVNIKTDEPQPDISLEVNRRLLEKCLHYLLFAALDSKDVSEVRCSIDVREREVIYHIRDNGKGESLSTRADTAVVRDAAGAPDQASDADGAGYSTARRLARKIGGEITLEISAGIGTEAALTLPR